MCSAKFGSDDVTFVVELTPAGRGAIAVVLVDGPSAVQAVGKSFSAISGQPVAEAPIGRIVFGRWGGESGEELIVCRRAAEQIEVHCHGGTAAVGRVVDDLVTSGCRRISWQEWVDALQRRTSVRSPSASRSDAATGNAQIALADATTERTAAVLLDQFHGALSDAIRDAIGAVVASDWARAAEIVDELIGRAKVGLHLVSPWRVVLAGAPNVGKSSLINALAGFERAIVSPIPGTTRDVVTAITAIDGWPVQLMDTAGLRASEDEIEAAGVALATAAMSRADLVLLVLDAAQSEAGVRPSAIDAAPAGSLIHVINKIDLLSPSARTHLQHHGLHVSALTGENITQLIAAISRELVPESPPPGAAVPFIPEQVDRLTQARRAIDKRSATSATTALQALLSGNDATKSE